MSHYTRITLDYYNYTRLTLTASNRGQLPTVLTLLIVAVTLTTNNYPLMAAGSFSTSDIGELFYLIGIFC